MEFLLIIVGALALSLGFQWYLGHRAMQVVFIDVGGLTIDQLLDVGTKASESFIQRLGGRAQPVRFQDGSIGWNAISRGGVMTFRVTQLPNGYGFRVEAKATTVKEARMGGYIDPKTTWGRSKILTNWIYLLLGIPQNARVLLRRRRQALRAIGRAGAVIGPPVPGKPGTLTP